ncbi:cytoplasmic protein [Antrihabitans sp. YC3-6]|uniref:Cytoplasmic protein n=1 Tax=Antrihabitans stalagmiti TaxID=2799499 RepID=A0A934NQB6_9NOCA|nr:cytoplasmic protein [Antrihabitans stalagmiti]MBJ8339305.1 cytoplasmic protein [Antrihabitans stalagmiti]
MSTDPAVTDPELYRVIFENDRVRILEYRDQPGARTQWHSHPDAVMVPLASFRRRIGAHGRQVEVQLAAGQPRWVGAQEHAGENIGDTDSHALFIELKEPGVVSEDVPIGPSPA